jgi:hypothetical protein
MITEEFIGRDNIIEALFKRLNKILKRRASLIL